MASWSSWTSVYAGSDKRLVNSFGGSSQFREDIEYRTRREVGSSSIDFEIRYSLYYRSTASSGSGSYGWPIGVRVRFNSTSDSDYSGWTQISPGGTWSYSGSDTRIGRTTWSFTISKNSGTVALQTDCNNQTTWGFDSPRSAQLYLTVPTTTYSITYDANGGSSTPSTQTKTHGTDITLAAAIKRANGSLTGYKITFDANGGSVSPTSKNADAHIEYTFSKWKATNGTQYDAKATYSKNASTTMTAQWSSSNKYGSITTPSATRGTGTAKHTVTYNATANGGTTSATTADSTATITYSANGWYTAKSGGTKRCNNGGSYTPSSAEKIYQQWGSSTGTYSQITLPNASHAQTDAADRTVTYNGNGGTPAKTSDTSKAKISYSLKGWYTAQSGGTSRGTYNSKYTPSASETLYAQFTGTTGTYSAVTLTTATRNYYTFNKWNTKADGTGTAYSSGTSYTPTGDVILFATWTLNAPTDATVALDYVTRNKIYVKSIGYTGAELTGYTLYYRVKGTSNFSSLSLGTSTSGVIEGLTPNTTYEIKVRATNSAGYKDSSLIEATTVAHLPSYLSISMSNILPFSATATVSATGDTNADVTNYKYYYTSKPSVNLYDMPIKSFDGARWARIFYHNNGNGSIVFESIAQCKDSQTTNRYSRLGLLDSGSTYKINGKYEFMLEYPTDAPGKYNRWRQTNAPQNDYITPTSTGDGVATGYEAIHIDWANNYWGGLTRQNEDTSSTTGTWLSGSVGHTNWFFAIGAFTSYQRGIPCSTDIGSANSPEGNSTPNAVELWIRIPDAVVTTGDMGTSTSTTVTGLSEETTYLFNMSATNIAGTNYSSTVEIETVADQAKIRIKDNGVWKKGKMWYKRNGVWVKAKKVYIKQNGEWVIGYNYENN